MMARGFSAPSQPSSIVTHKPRQVFDAIDDGEEPYLIDVRDPAHYEKERLSGTINVPLEALKANQAEDKMAVFDRTLPIYLHCDGTGVASRQAAEIFKQRGFADVRIIEGGVFEINRDSGLMILKGKQ